MSRRTAGWLLILASPPLTAGVAVGIIVAAHYVGLRSGFHTFAKTAFVGHALLAAAGAAVGGALSAGEAGRRIVAPVAAAWCGVTGYAVCFALFALVVLALGPRLS